MFGQDLDVKVWSKDFEFWNLIKICARTCFFGKQNSTLGPIVPLAMFDLVLCQEVKVIVQFAERVYHQHRQSKT